jgi:uncharacterized membrane protein
VTRIVLSVILLANGLGAGVMLSTVIGTVPLTLVLPYDRYVEMIQFMWPRYDPLMPAMNGLAFVLDVVLAATTGDNAARPFLVVGAALLAVVMGISVSKNVPINRFVTGLDPARRPVDWVSVDPRRRWQTWNTLRTSLALVALVANVIATAA